MKKSLKTLLLTSLFTLTGCKSLYIDTFCVRYEPFKISCNKEKLPVGSVCSDVISDETINSHLLNELQFTKGCL